MMIHAARGSHAMLDLAGCEHALLDDARRLRHALVGAVERAGATVLHTIVYPFDPQGVSVMCVLAESHASIHTYPEHGVCMIDVFTCGDDIDPLAAANDVATSIPHSRAHAQLAQRGVAPRTR